MKKKLFGIIVINFKKEGNSFQFKKLLHKGFIRNKYGASQFTRSKSLPELHEKIIRGYRSTKLVIKKNKVYELLK
tara:strand:+ start:330 stop:554 length:225 start_codon:yes stop_codon:yes gene_type:complete